MSTNKQIWTALLDTSICLKLEQTSVIVLVDWKAKNEQLRDISRM